MQTYTQIKRWSFEYIYMILMIIYMAQMTPATNRLLGSLSSDFIPLLIPLLPTLYLFFKYKVRLNTQFLKLALIFCIWLVAILIKYDYWNDFGFISYHLILLISLFIAYTHTQVYGQAFSDIYEDIMVKFAMISIPLWVFSLIPGSDSFFRLFPVTAEGSTAGGTNLLYIYHWLDPNMSSMDISYRLARNSGLTWEPGRFSVMLCIALWNNLSNNGIRFMGNKNALILLIALVTTFSTTGYIAVACLYTIFYIKGFSLRTLLKLLVIVIPAFMILMNFGFVGDKISRKSDVVAEVDNFYSIESYYSTRGGLEKHMSLDRMISISFEFENIKQDPILGYSRNVHNSWFGKTFGDDYSLTGGLLKTFGQYGLLLGAYIFSLLFISSRLLSKNKTNNRKYALAILLMICSVSYGFLESAVFMTFWFYGAFGYHPYCKIED